MTAESLNDPISDLLKTEVDEAVALYAAENAGTEFDLDGNLEAAGVEHILTTDVALQ
jgi:hypothetical protein